MEKKKATRNRTMDMDVEEGREYLDRCIQLSEPVRTMDELLNHTVLGDFFEAVQYIPHNSVDLIIADPPYNIYKDYHGNHFSKKKKDEYEAYTRQWLDAVIPLLKENGSIYVCCDWESSMIIGPILMEKLQVRNRITWQREKGRGAKKNWKNGMEDIWYATVSKEFTFHVDAVKLRKKVVAPYRVDGKPKDWVESEAGNYRDTHPSNLWNDITIPFWSMPENTAHPTQKPEKLIAKIILASSDPGAVVFDPFLGSGTTSVVAKKLNRSYLGIEQNPRYCVWAEKRLELAEQESGIQGYVDGVFWERNSYKAQKRDEYEE